MAASKDCARKSKSYPTIVSVQSKYGDSTNGPPDLMSDSLIQPCLEESEMWSRMYERIQRERSEIEELASFEMAASRRMAYLAKHARPDWSTLESSDMAGLDSHTCEPRLMTEHDLIDGQAVDSAFRHRERNSSSHMLPLSLATARPVT